MAGISSLAFTAAAIVTGVQQELGISCEVGYAVGTDDYSHNTTLYRYNTAYKFTTLACRLGNGLSVCVLVTLLLVIATYSIRLHAKNN